MKKIVVLAVFLVVIGVLCAVFFPLGKKWHEETEKKPWTFDSNTTSAAETTGQATTQGFTDAVKAFTDYVDTELREDYAFLSEEEPTAQKDLSDALLSIYIYDADTDGTEEMSVVRTTANGVTLDMYEFGDGKVRFAASKTFSLDPMNDVSLSLTDPLLRHVQARLAIYPSGADRYFCLTVEQQTAEGEYDAYTVVLEYAKEKLTVKKSYRLRQTGDVVTLMCTDNVTLLYRQAAGQSAAEGTDVTLAKYGDLNTAFKTEYAKLGLNPPQVKVENGKLTQYKVTAVKSEQKLFDVTVDGGQIHTTENGFLQSFILRR